MEKRLPFFLKYFDFFFFFFRLTRNIFSSIEQTSQNQTRSDVRAHKEQRMYIYRTGEESNKM